MRCSGNTAGAVTVPISHTETELKILNIDFLRFFCALEDAHFPLRSPAVRVPPGTHTQCARGGFVVTVKRCPCEGKWLMSKGEEAMDPSGREAEKRRSGFA